MYILTTKWATEVIPIMKNLSQSSNINSVPKRDTIFETIKSFRFKTDDFKFWCKSKGEIFSLNKEQNIVIADTIQTYSL